MIITFTTPFLRGQNCTARISQINHGQNYTVDYRLPSTPFHKISGPSDTPRAILKSLGTLKRPNSGSVLPIPLKGIEDRPSFHSKPPNSEQFQSILKPFKTESNKYSRPPKQPHFLRNHNYYKNRINNTIPTSINQNQKIPASITQTIRSTIPQHSSIHKFSNKTPRFPEITKNRREYKAPYLNSSKLTEHFKAPDTPASQNYGNPPTALEAPDPLLANTNLPKRNHPPFFFLLRTQERRWSLGVFSLSSFPFSLYFSRSLFSE